MTRVLGLDLSLTSTGYACPDCGTGTISVRSRGLERLVELRDEILSHAITADVVVLEGYAFAAHAAHAHALGELGGVVRVALFEAGIPVAEVPPASLKRFATGKGAANKDAMIAAAIRHFGFEGSTNDEADAWLLRCMGLAYYDELCSSAPGPAPVLSYQRQAIAKIAWPVPRPRAAS